MNSPSAVKALSAAIAAPRVSVGRMIEQIGNRRRRKIVGSGMIRLVWVSSPSALRSGKTKPFVGSVRGGALPALSCQVWKCIISVPPMLSRIRNTSLSVTRWASDAYRLVPPCSRQAKWKPAGSAGDFGVLDAAEFVVLLPQIGFDDFCCRQESKNVRVSHREINTRARSGGISQQSGADGSCSDGERSAQKGTAAHRTS